MVTDDAADLPCLWCGKTLAEHLDKLGKVVPRMPCLGQKSHFTSRRVLADGGRLQQCHALKCWPEPYQAMVDGRKRFEFRYNDRDYRVGDVLSLREYKPSTDEYTGREISMQVSYVLTKDYGIPSGYVVMSLEPVPLP